MYPLQDIFSYNVRCANPRILPSLTFQLAMLPSVMVGDMAGIVKFWAARHREQLLNPVDEQISIFY